MTRFSSWPLSMRLAGLVSILGCILIYFYTPLGAWLGWDAIELIWPLAILLWPLIVLIRRFTFGALHTDPEAAEEAKDLARMFDPLPDLSERRQAPRPNHDD